jgi:hypothetical protein
MAGGCYEVSPPGPPQHISLVGFTIYIAKDNSPPGVLPSHDVFEKKKMQDSHAYVEVVPHLSHESSLYWQFLHE